MRFIRFLLSRWECVHDDNMRSRYYGVIDEGHSHQVINDWRPCVVVVTPPLLITCACVFVYICTCRYHYIRERMIHLATCPYHLYLLHYFAAGLSSIFISTPRKIEVDNIYMFRHATITLMIS